MVKKFYQIEIGDEKHIAKAMAKNVPISLKYSVELAREIKGRPVKKAEDFIDRVLRHETYLPLRKYNKKVGHRRGKPFSHVKSGRYPTRTLKAFRDLLNSVKENADYKGLESENLIISHIFASQGFRRMSNQPQGRISGKSRKKKSTHIEIVVREAK